VKNNAKSDSLQIGYKFNENLIFYHDLDTKKNLQGQFVSDAIFYFYKIFEETEKNPEISFKT
jgi:hypothetical protein